MNEAEIASLQKMYLSFGRGEETLDRHVHEGRVFVDPRYRQLLVQAHIQGKVRFKDLLRFTNTKPEFWAKNIDGCFEDYFAKGYFTAACSRFLPERREIPSSFSLPPETHT